MPPGMEYARSKTHGGPMNRQQRGVVAVHGAYALYLIVAAAWIALVLGENDPSDDWMISARMVFWPIAAMVGLVAAGVAAATYRWARHANRSILFLADMVVPVLALITAGPLIVDPSFMADFPVLAGAVVFALICGGFVAAVRPRPTVARVEPNRPLA